MTITPSARGFSPNRDNRFESIRITPATASDAEIERWQTEIIGSGRRVVFRTEGRGPLPADPIEWDGMVSAGSGRDQVAPDGSYVAELTVEFEKGNISRAASAVFSIDTQPPVVRLTVRPRPFSPDGDGRDDTVSVGISVRDANAVGTWAAEVVDPTGQPFWSRRGSRAVPTELVWNGRSTTDELVQSAQQYPVRVTVTDVFANAATVADTLETDVLVVREGTTLRIVLSNINFAPFTADYLNLAPDIVASNLETLDRVYEVLAGFPDYQIRIEGHAVSLLWADPERARVEHEEVLMPLSLARAEAIKRALVERGIDAGRIQTHGFGGSQPVVPHGDTVNRWKSRRVEFVLEQ